MTGPAVRLCLDCGIRFRGDGPRCVEHERAHQRRRNQARVQYQGAWKRRSLAERRAQPWCSVCGTPFDLTLDHETGQVQCRTHNSSHRRDVPQ